MNGFQKTVLVLLCFILPPLPIYMVDRKFWTWPVGVAILLTLCSHLPGFIFSLYYIFHVHPAENLERLVGSDEERPLVSDDGSGEPRLQHNAPLSDILSSGRFSEEPPSYDDSVKLSSDRRPSISKDNKVQH